jgi:hypothetical protein
MARPRKKGMDYFPHDTDASSDEKIEALRAVYGNDGYAFYFILLERIYRTDNAELDVSKPIMYASIASKVGVSKELFSEMLEVAFDLELFSRQDYEERKVITSKGIKRRFSEVNKLRERWRKNKEKKTEVFHEENCMENDMENRVENVGKTGESKEKKNNNTSSSRQKRVYDEASPYYQLALRLYQAIKRNLPEFKEPNLQSWADDMRKLAEIDGKHPENIAKVIDWVQSDSFWWKNVMSASKLRKQYDRLLAEIRSRSKQNTIQYKSDEPRSRLQVIDINNLFGT